MLPGDALPDVHEALGLPTRRARGTLRRRGSGVSAIGGSGSGKRHALESQDLGEAIEVPVTVEHGQAAVLSSSRADQRVGDLHPVVAIAALGQLAQRSHRRNGDGAVVAQDAQGVQLALERQKLRARACRVEHFHADDRRRQEAVLPKRPVHQRLQLGRQCLDAPPRRGVGDEEGIAAEQLESVQRRALLVLDRALESGERLAIEALGPAQPLGELRESPRPLLLAEGRVLRGRDTGADGMSHGAVSLAPLIGARRTFAEGRGHGPWRDC